jgi:hypothetical protein
VKNEAYSRTARAVTSALLLFALTSAAFGQSVTPSEQVLHAFAGGSDGAIPYAGLAADGHGNLFGTTQQGGDGACAVEVVGCGTLFELATNGQGNASWRESVIYDFQGPEGANPVSPLIVDKAGNVYGTTYFGGSSNGCSSFGCGTVFELQNTEFGWVLHVLYDFSGTTDGAHPQGGLVFDSVGNLYGTTAFGGEQSCTSSRGGPGCGVVFELQHLKDRWFSRVLHTFKGTDGANPSASLIMDPAGNLYGTAWGGGNGGGLIFELQRSNFSTAAWVESILMNFPGSEGLGTPDSSVTLDSAGNLYGTTEFGGDYGSGSAFELTKSGSVWNETVLHSFSGGSDGGYPNGGLVFDKSGKLYGTASFGGSGNSGTYCPLWCGVVFELSSENGTWSETVLHAFEGGSDGEIPYGNLLDDTRGRIYGATINGGDLSCQVSQPNYACGLIYRIAP